MATTERVPAVERSAIGTTLGRRPRGPSVRWPDLLRPVGILLAARLLMLMVLGLAKNVIHSVQLFPANWDGSWYVKAAQYGWPHAVPTTGGHVAQSTLAFFPGFPVLIRAVHLVVPVSWVHAGDGAALLSEVTMAVTFWVLTRDIWDDKVADRATLLLCFFPGALIFSLIYSEPLLITFAAICIYALRKGHWEVAGLAAALATATRPNGVALIACCAWEAYRAIHARRAWRSLIAPVLAPAGIVVWFGYLWATTGSVMAWFRTEQGGWGEKVDPLALRHLIVDDLHHPLLYPNLYVPLIGTLGVVLIIVVLGVLMRPGVPESLRRVPSVLIVFTAVILAMSIMSRTLGLRPRFILTAFPLIMVLGYRLRGSAHALVTACFAGLMSMLLLVTVATIALVP